MIRIDKYASFQPANVEATETQAQSAATSPPQSEAVDKAPTAAANSANTWQRASLAQDGLTQQNVLHNNLDKQDYAQLREAAEKNKEAREDRQSGSLFGTIFLGPIIGTIIGKEIDPSTSKRDELKNMMKEKQEDIQRLQKELEEAIDNSSFETFGDWLSGSDSGQSEIGQSEIAQTSSSNPLKDLAIEARPKLHDPDED
jgi:hypothetical protein